MATVNYQGNDVDFKQVFYPYILHREGYRNIVYNDSEGIPTVGIGHEVVDGDNLAVGDAISNDRVQSLFSDDYDRLGIDPYIQELLDIGYSYNMGLAVGSFIWMHGLGNASDIGYEDSQLRKGLLAQSFTADSVLTYLAANWDTRKPEDANRDKEDFTIGFSDTPWTPDFFTQHPRA